ncbi:MAG: hypothetical protein ACJ8AW_28345 [Rhodopila sp.]
MTFSRTASSRLLWFAALGTLCLVLVAPLLVVDVPPLVDYPNHLARIFVLASLPDDPVIARFYAAQWAIIPNLALDLLGPPLLRIMPVHDAGCVLIAAAVLLPVLGCVAYSAALGGRWWSLGVGLVAYNRTLLEGFLNFNLSVGLALLLAAAWTHWRGRHSIVMTAVAALGAVALFTCHLMGLVLFAVLLCADELVRLLAGRLVLRPRAAAPARLALVFTAPVVLYALSPLQQLGGDAVYLSPFSKLSQLLAAYTNYVWLLDLLTALAALGTPCICLLVRRGRLPPQAAMAAVLLLGAYLMTPYAWKGTQQIDTRFAIMLGVLLFAGFQPQRWPRWFSRTAAAVIVLLFVIRMTALTSAFAEHRRDLADLRAALHPVQPGQAVYVVLARPDDAQRYNAAAPLSRWLSDGIFTGTHLGALALIERHAWWPFEFDNASQQPIRTLEPYETMALRIGDLPDQDTLARADLCGFDVVLVLQADATAPLPDRRFRRLAGQRFAQSYAINDCRPGG